MVWRPLRSVGIPAAAAPIGERRLGEIAEQPDDHDGDGHEIDANRHARVTPPRWLRQSLDRSPLGGVEVAVQFRRLFAP